MIIADKLTGEIGEQAVQAFTISAAAARNSATGTAITYPHPFEVVLAADGSFVTPDLDPGPAVVTIGTTKYPITIPTIVDVPSGVTRLWPLIAAGIAFPPGTPTQVLADATTAYLTANPVSEHIFTRDTTLTLAALQCGDVIFNGSTGVTFTLPTITVDTVPGNVHLGCWFDIWNVSASSLTVVTNGVQLFNKVTAKTSLTVATLTGLKVVACKTNSGTLFWAARAFALA